MNLRLINVGSQPNAGDGDPLRVAFTKINSNFTELYTLNNQLISNGVPITSYVASVAGKTGNVSLTVNDVQGAVSSGYVSNAISSGLTAYINDLRDGLLNWPGYTPNSIPFLAIDQATFPAYPNIVPVPVSSIGQPGDAATDIAFDDSYFYYCVGDYDGVTNIWRRIANDASAW